jgi:hypothetical protein
MKAYNLQHIKTALLSLIRILGYALLVTLLSELIRYDAIHTRPQYQFSEDSLTEQSQSVMLLLSAALFLYAAYRHKPFRSLSILLFCFAMASAVREQDAFLDEYFFRGSWKIGAFPLLIFPLFIIWRNTPVFLSAIHRFSYSLAFGILLSCLLTTYVFSRLMGRTIFWMAVMGENYLHDVKTAAEETLELYGYLLLLLAAIEYLFFLAKRQSNASAVQEVII